MKFILSEIVLYVHKYILAAANCYFDMFNNQQKQLYSTVSTAFAATKEPVGYASNLTSLSLLLKDNFGQCSYQLTSISDVFILTVSRIVS